MIRERKPMSRVSLDDGEKMREKYRQELEELKGDVFILGKIVRKAVEDAVIALETQDVILANSVIEGDNTVDESYRSLEERCLQFIALQQPVARDLRMLITTVKVLMDLERIGDYAQSIAEITIKLKDEKYFKPLFNIRQMTNIVVNMIGKSMDIYLLEESEKSDEVFVMDEKVDGFYHTLFRELETYMAENPKTITQSSYFMLVARHLERIGDHALNIANRVVYMVNAEKKYI